MRLTILGAGNGGLAMAADWVLHGHQVSLFDFKEFSIQIDAINKNGGVHVEGALEGFARLDYAGSSIEEALCGSELIIIVGPAYSTKPFAKIIKPHIKKGQHIVVCPGSIGGGLIVKKELDISNEDESIIVAETSTLPYAARIIEPGRVHIYNKLKGGIYLGALPTNKTEFMMKMFDEVYKAFDVSQHYFHTMLQNANPVIHPAVSILNAGRIDDPNSSFKFYEEGITNRVGLVIEAVDVERIKIGEMLGIKILPDPVIGIMQGYMLEDNYNIGYRMAPGFKGVVAQSQLDHRYLNEDVGYGLVFMKDLAVTLGVETPIIDSLINVASVLMERDYIKEQPRTLTALGLGELTADELYENFKI